MTLLWSSGRPLAEGVTKFRSPRCRRLPSVLLCVAAWLSILPIVAVTTGITNNKESSWSVIPNVWHSKYNKHVHESRWVAFLRGGHSSSNEATSANDVIEATKSSSSVATTTEYRTVQVQIVHRHGDRSPITPLKDESYWESTLVPPEMLQQVARGTKVLHHESIDDGSNTKHVAHGRGPFGKLTKMGLLQMIDVGSRLKEELEQTTRWSSKARFVTIHNNGVPISISPQDMKVFSRCIGRLFPRWTL
jgi:hypothetical protein